VLVVLRLVDGEFGGFAAEVEVMLEIDEPVP
jgi:hypothetical protein